MTGFVEPVEPTVDSIDLPVLTDGQVYGHHGVMLFVLCCLVNALLGGLSLSCFHPHDQFDLLREFFSLPVINPSLVPGFQVERNWPIGRCVLAAIRRARSNRRPKKV